MSRKCGLKRNRLLMTCLLYTSVRLDFQQEDGFVSALPLGVNRIKIQRGLTTSAVAVFVPFTKMCIRDSRTGKAGTLKATDEAAKGEPMTETKQTSTISE